MILQILMVPYQTKRSTKVMDRILSIIFIVLNNQLAKYVKLQMTYNDPALVLKITPLNSTVVILLEKNNKNIRFL